MNSEYRYLDELTERYPVLAPVRRDIEKEIPIKKAPIIRL